MQPERRRDEILKAASRVFARQGYHRTSVAEIIAEAGIARGTFYLYFPGKGEIFSELVDVFAVRIGACLQRIQLGKDRPSWEEQLKANILKLAALLLEESELTAILYHHSKGLDPIYDAKIQEFYGRVLQAIAGALALGQEMGIVRPGLKLELAARHMLGSIKEMFYSLTVSRPAPAALEAMVDEMVGYHLRGLAPEASAPGRRRGGRRD